MSDHLRFTPDEYLALCRATLPLWLNGSFTDFRRCLVGALRPRRPALADRIAGLRTRQVRLLRHHLAGEARSPAE